MVYINTKTRLSSAELKSVAFESSPDYGERWLANESLAEEPARDSMARRPQIKHRLPTSERTSSVVARPIEPGVFRKEGEFWTIVYRGKVVHLKDSKGLGYIATLLRSPGSEFHALDLSGGAIVSEGSTAANADRPNKMNTSQRALEGEGLSIGDLGDAGDVLDAQAVAEYRDRISELEEELETAKRLDDLERGVKAEEEINELKRQLSQALDIHKRKRVTNSPAERARLSVFQAIRGAVGKIRDGHKELGSLLDRSIKTGAFCSYDLERTSAIEWEFGAATSYFANIASGVAVEQQEPEPHRASHGTISQAQDVEPLGFSLSNRTEFVGRETELAEIGAVIQRTLNGRGSVVLVAGGAGVGKTRLAVEAAREAWERGAIVLKGCCYATEEPHPYLPFVEILEMALRRVASKEAFRQALGNNASELAQLLPRLRQLFTDIPPALELPPTQARRYLFDSVFEFIARAARTRPTLLLLDDLHWADESTLALLDFLSSRIAEVPVLLLATYRDVDPDTSESFLKTVETLVRHGVRPIRLSGLPPDSVAGMLRVLCGAEAPARLVNAICRETDGNPFFIEELVKHLIEERSLFDESGRLCADPRIDEFDIPETVRLVVGRRLDRLTKTTRQVLVAAAAIGRSFSFNLLENLESFDEDSLLLAIEEALKAGLILPSSMGPEAPFNFKHELVRQCLQAETAQPRRERLHLQVACAIEKAYARTLDDHAVEIADHLTKAGTKADGPKLVYYLSVAGERALRAAAYEDALRHLTEAVSRHDPSDRAKHAELLSELATVKRSLGRWQEALGHWNESLDLYVALGDRGSIGGVCVAMGEAFTWSGRYLEAMQITQHGLTHLEGLANGDRARLLSRVAVIHAAAGSHEPARDATAGACALAEQLSDDKLLGEVLSNKSFFDFIFMRTSEAVSEGLRSANLLRSSGAQWKLVEILCFVRTALCQLGRVEEASSIGAEVGPLAKKMGHHAALALWMRMEGWTELCLRCDFDKLEEWTKRDLEVTRTASLAPSATSFAQLALVEFLRGDWEAALARAEEASRLEFPNAFEGFAAGMLFRQKAYCGDRQGALALLNQKRERLPRLGEPSPLGSWAMLLLIVEGLVVLNERKYAAELYPLVLREVETGNVYVAAVSRFPQTIAALAAAAGEQWNLAEEHFEAAMKQAVEFPHRLEQTEIRRFYGQMLIERGLAGDREKARAILAEATQGYTQLGMRRHSQIATALLKEAVSTS